MKASLVGAYLAACVLAIGAGPRSGIAQAGAAPAERDGQHDFDFEAGHWRMHLKRLVNPLTGSKQWVELDGTSITRPIWKGHAWIEEFESDGSSGHIEGLTLRTYNPQAHQWYLDWANSRNGMLVVPQIGQFKNGQGEFYAQDTLNGKSIFVRFVWSKTNSNAPHFEQAFSDDGGKTWEVNWITDQTRLPDSSDKAVAQAQADPSVKTPLASAERDGQHDFDFMFGTWTYHLKRLLHPLSGSTAWIEYDGSLIGHRVWGGRANLGETEADGPNGRVMGLTLRTYNPQTHQWYLYWANSRDGVISVPQIGQFRNGVGEFLSQDTFNDRAVLVRYVWTATNPDSPRFEQSFSNDAGRTWEVNWITEQKRVSEDASVAH